MKTKKSVPILVPFLILVSMLFIGILIFAYVETKKANPQMIEQSSVGRSAWSAAGVVEVSEVRVQGDPRGPGGPPHRS